MRGWKLSFRGKASALPLSTSRWLRFTPRIDFALATEVSSRLKLETDHPETQQAHS